MLAVNDAVLSQFGSDHFLVRILVLVVCGVVLSLALKFAYAAIHKKLALSHKIWDDALTKAVYLPMQIGIGIVTFFYCLSELDRHFHFIFFSAIDLVYQLCLLALVIAAAISFTRKVEERIVSSQKRKIDFMVVKATSRIFHLIILALGALSALQIFGIPLSAVIAFGGVGGIAVGFAAKDFLANLFGGLMIFIGRPFAIGDMIKLPDRSIEGYVEQISWRQCILRTYEQRLVYIPNSLFSTVMIENVSRMKCRRILFDVGVSIEDFPKVSKICADLEGYIRSRKDIDSSLLCYVRLTEVTQGSLMIRVWCYPFTKILPEALKVQQEILVKLHDIMVENEAEFALPTTILMDK
jgi:MscS family membrane protein